MTTVESMVQITLPRDFVGQIVDGLNSLIEQWEATAVYLEHGEAEPDGVIRECSSAGEALAIAEYYRSIVRTIERQLPSFEQ